MTRLNTIVCLVALAASPLLAPVHAQDPPVEGETEDGRLWVLRHFDEDSGPIYDIQYNEDAAISTATDFVRLTSPFNVDGTGWSVGLWEPGLPTAHAELGPRLTFAAFQTGLIHWHPTHVAGTIAAAGLDPAAMGMAPGVVVEAFDSDLDTFEMIGNGAAFAGQAGRHYVSNHSYGTRAGWDLDGTTWTWWGFWTVGGPPVESQFFGQYNQDAADWDDVVVQRPFFLPVKAVGNDRNDPAPGAGTNFSFWFWNGAQWSWETLAYDPVLHPAGDGVVHAGYDTIPTYSTAKNILSVGAVEDAAFAGGRDLGSPVCPGCADMTTFSGWGPTDDGRIKPDVVANGTTVHSTDAGGGYRTSSGTSMAAPNVSGSAVLLAQLYNDTHPGAWMQASTLKGLIIHTADDLDGTGPDYRNGWGLMNTHAAAEMIDDHVAAPHRIQELTITNGQTITLDLAHTGNGPIRVTMCWTDPVGAAVAWSQPSPAPVLVNDLDFELLRPGGVINRPWILDPNFPANGATFGFNHVDNVERFDDYFNPPAGAYTLTIAHTGPLAGGSQDFALFLTGLEPASGACCDTVGVCSVETPADCLSLGGVYAGTGLDCLSVACPPPGACCDPLGACSVITPNACANIGGTFNGQGTACGTYTCADFDYAPALSYGAGGATPVALATFDEDLDGDLDIAVGTADGGSTALTLLENDGTGAYTQLGQIPMFGFNVVRIEAADFDADGDIDLIVADAIALRVYRKDGPSFVLVASVGISGVVDMVAGDFDGDCDLDLAVASSSPAPNQNIFIVRGLMSFPTIVTTGFSAATSPRAMAAGDVDGDGDLDLVVANENFGTMVFNDGAGGFPNTWNGWNFQIGGFFDGLRAAALADLTGNGVLEAIFANRTRDEVIVMTYTGTLPAFGNSIIHNVGAAPIDIATGDLDGDGDLDVALACESAASLQLMANLGAGSLSVPVDYPVGPVPKEVTLADLDGDGALDMAAPILGTGQVQALRNQTEQDCNANGIADDMEITSSMTFVISGVSNAGDCAWRITGPGYDEVGTLCVQSGAGGDGYATAIVASINAGACPGLRARREFGLLGGFTVSAPGAGMQFCIGPPAVPTCCFPAAPFCVCNPTVEQILLSGEDCNANGMDDTIDLLNGNLTDDDGNGIPDECEIVLGDTNGDNVVNVDDLVNVIQQWGCLGADCSADVNGDGIVDVNDLVTVIQGWSPAPPAG